MTALLTATGVGWQRQDGTPVIAAVNLTLAAGTLTFVHGPARSGKTTLVQLLAGWLTATVGNVTLTNSAESAADVAVVPQALALLDELTVSENITIVDRVQHRLSTMDDDLLDVVDRLGLRHLLDRSVQEISIGERQRVMIARALARRPEILLVDEPTAHQDTANAESIHALMRDAVERGSAVLIATRDTNTGLPSDAHFALREQRLVTRWTA